MSTYFNAPDLLKSPPVFRAAYSDRTAWIMAELSRLVYEPLPQEVSITRLVSEIKEVVASDSAESTVTVLLRKALQAEQGSSNEVASLLEEAGFEFLESFDQGGTEAFLARLQKTEHFDGMLILVFRGTQPGVSDVLTDIKADLVAAPGGGRAHRGFLEAFERVKEPVQSALKNYEGLPVYITGHSLGGALAILAIRYLEKNSQGACYTFGGPRVGDDDLFKGIKTPVYRVVNAADGVPRVPFGFGLKLVLGVFRFIPVNGTLAISEFLRKKFIGYTHYGYLVFLSGAANTPGKDGISFQKLKVWKSPNFFRNATLVIARLLQTGGKASFQDHGSREYAEKLKAYALRRNL
ncbi:lipase family protein [Marinospirillum sp.]|uniref:lipase family protein n=1 Tax=Marinospirillum sp. TaxID=2183934 RepID=UPI00384E0BE1